MNILVIDGCIRKELSRTKQLGNYFIQGYQKKCDQQKISIDVTTLALQELNLNYFDEVRLAERDNLIAQNKLNHKNFVLAHQFAMADKIIVLAPFWDLGLPAIVKVYIENISVDGITFGISDQGICGRAAASDLIYITTRGGILKNKEMDIGTKYLDALCKMYGIKKFHSIYTEGTDDPSLKNEDVLKYGYESADRVISILD